MHQVLRPGCKHLSHLQDGMAVLRRWLNFPVLLKDPLSSLLSAPPSFSCTERISADARVASPHLQDLGEDGGGEEGSVLDDDVVALVLIGHVELVQEVVRRLAHHHGAEQLPAQPGAAARGHALLDQRHLHMQRQPGCHQDFATRMIGMASADSQVLPVRIDKLTCSRLLPQTSCIIEACI